MKRTKNLLDERQEQQLLRIEHFGCWIAFWGLFALLMVETALGLPQRELAGETLVFMGLALYLVVACLRHGIWDRHLKPTRTTNALLSLASGGGVGVFYFFLSYHNYGDLVTALITAVSMFLSIFVTCFLALWVTSALCLRKQRKLDSASDADEEL